MSNNKNKLQGPSFWSDIDTNWQSAWNIGQSRSSNNGPVDKVAVISDQSSTSSISIHHPNDVKFYSDFKRRNIECAAAESTVPNDPDVVDTEIKSPYLKTIVAEDSEKYHSHLRVDLDQEEEQDIMSSSGNNQLIDDGEDDYIDARNSRLLRSLPMMLIEDDDGGDDVILFRPKTHNFRNMLNKETETGGSFAGNHKNDDAIQDTPSSLPTTKKKRNVGAPSKKKLQKESVKNSEGEFLKSNILGKISVTTAAVNDNKKKKVREAYIPPSANNSSQLSDPITSSIETSESSLKRKKGPSSRKAKGADASPNIEDSSQVPEPVAPEIQISNMFDRLGFNPDNPLKVHVIVKTKKIPMTIPMAHHDQYEKTIAGTSEGVVVNLTKATITKKRKSSALGHVDVHNAQSEDLDIETFNISDDDDDTEPSTFGRNNNNPFHYSSSKKKKNESDDHQMKFIIASYCIWFGKGDDRNRFIDSSSTFTSIAIAQAEALAFAKEYLTPYPHVSLRITLATKNIMEILVAFGGIGWSMPQHTKFCANTWLKTWVAINIRSNVSLPPHTITPDSLPGVLSSVEKDAPFIVKTLTNRLTRLADLFTAISTISQIEIGAQ